MTKFVGCAFHLPLLSLHHQSVGEHPNWMLQPKLHFTIRPDGSIVTNSRGWAKTKKALETEIIMAEKCPGWSPEVEGEFGWILWKLATESLEKHLNCPSFLSALGMCYSLTQKFVWQTLCWAPAVPSELSLTLMIATMATFNVVVILNLKKRVLPGRTTEAEEIYSGDFQPIPKQLGLKLKLL